MCPCRSQSCKHKTLCPTSSWLHAAPHLASTPATLLFLQSLSDLSEEPTELHCFIFFSPQSLKCSAQARLKKKNQKEYKRKKKEEKGKDGAGGKWERWCGGKLCEPKSWSLLLTRSLGALATSLPDSPRMRSHVRRQRVALLSKHSTVGRANPAPVACYSAAKKCSPGCLCLIQLSCFPLRSLWL